MSVSEKKYLETIDLTPTWEEILPSLLLVLEAGNAEGRVTAKEELIRMAKLADLYVQNKGGNVAFNPREGNVTL